MSVQSALQFIGQVRRDEALRASLQALGPLVPLENIVALGAEAGFDFTTADLRAAHRHDWAMRWLRDKMAGPPA